MLWRTFCCWRQFVTTWMFLLAEKWHPSSLLCCVAFLNMPMHRETAPCWHPLKVSLFAVTCRAVYLCLLWCGRSFPPFWHINNHFFWWTLHNIWMLHIMYSAPWHAPLQRRKPCMINDECAEESFFWLSYSQVILILILICMSFIKSSYLLKGESIFFNRRVIFVKSRQGLLFKIVGSVFIKVKALY